MGGARRKEADNLDEDPIQPHDPLDRQVKESTNILSLAKKPSELLNLKSEWGGPRYQGSKSLTLKDLPGWKTK